MSRARVLESRKERWRCDLRAADEERRRTEGRTWSALKLPSRPAILRLVFVVWAILHGRRMHMLNNDQPPRPRERDRPRRVLGDGSEV